MKKIITSGIMLSAVLCRAELIVAFWDFGPNADGYTENAKINNTEGEVSLDIFGSGHQASGQAGTSFTDAEGSLHGAGQALSWNLLTNEDQGWVLSADLSGFEKIRIRWDYRCTSSGPSSADLQYKAACGEWIGIDTVDFTRDSAFHEYSMDLSFADPVENNPSVQFRLTDFSGASSTSGTFRMDNLQLSAVPEPAAFMMLAIGTLLIYVFRRKRKT